MVYRELVLDPDLRAFIAMHLVGHGGHGGHGSHGGHGGKCGHGAGILIEDEVKSQYNPKVTEWVDYEQGLARTREHRDCKWPVNYSQRHGVVQRSNASQRRRTFGKR